jgi:hypothetical protein
MSKEEMGMIALGIGVMGIAFVACFLWPMFLLRNKPLLPRVFLSLFFGPLIAMGTVLSLAFNNVRYVVVMNPEDLGKRESKP